MLGDSLHVDLDYISATETYTSDGMIWTADRGNALRSDVLGVPQVAYDRTQDTADQLFGCGALGDLASTNLLTSAGTVLTVPADSVWLIKERVELVSLLTIDLAVANTYYVFLHWDGTNATLTAQLTSTRPLTSLAILIAKVVSNGATLSISQTDATVDVVCVMVPLLSTNYGTHKWTLGGYTTTAPGATGYVTVTINGATYKLLASNV